VRRRKVPIKKTKVMVLIDGVRLDGEPRRAGEVVELPDELVGGWLSSGLATTDLPEATTDLPEATPDLPEATPADDRLPLLRAKSVDELLSLLEELEISEDFSTREEAEAAIVAAGWRP
jgi:hypothetical protein